MKRGWKPTPDSVTEWGLDHPACFACGARRGLETHHIIAGRRDGCHNLANLVRLCHGCHEEYQVTSRAMIVKALRLKRQHDYLYFSVGAVVRLWRESATAALIEEITREIDE